MSQATVGPRKNIERQTWTELTPQALYDKCLTLAKNLWWSWHPEVVNLFRDLDPIKWRKVDHNPIVLLAEMTPEQLADRAAGDGALYPHQSGPSTAQGISVQFADHLGRTRSGRAGLEARGLFLGRVRPARIGADLLGRLGSALRRPYQECQRPGRSPGGHRSVLRPGLFQAAAGSIRISAGRISGHARREPAHRAGNWRERQAGHDLDRNSRRRAAGEGLADARRPRAVVFARLRRGGQQPAGPGIDLAALRRRRADADSPGTGAGRRRRQGAAGTGHHARRLSPERRS